MKHLVTPRTNPMPPVARPSKTAQSPIGSSSPSTHPIDTATLELLAAWRAQDATTNPRLLRAAERELADFQAAMNDNRLRAGEPPLFP
jgi:hypothetical protein